MIFLELRKEQEDHCRNDPHGWQIQPMFKNEHQRDKYRCHRERDGIAEHTKRQKWILFPEVHPQVYKEKNENHGKQRSHRIDKAP